MRSLDGKGCRGIILKVQIHATLAYRHCLTTCQQVDKPNEHIPLRGTLRRVFSRGHVDDLDHGGPGRNLEQHLY
jgi:hypothetical protein